MDIPGFDRLNECPVTPGCTAKLVFRDQKTNKVYRLDLRSGRMEDHHCKSMASEKPDKVYLGEWLNLRNKRTRYIGPHRMRSSAENVPKDARYAETDWQLVDTHVGVITWQSLKK